MESIGEFARDNQYLEKLFLSNNQFADAGMEILSEHLVGNTTLKVLDLTMNYSITNASVPYIIEIAKKSCVIDMCIRNTKIEDDKIKEVETFVNIPIDQREIPVKSNSKSAAKSTVFTNQITRY